MGTSTDAKLAYGIDLGEDLHHMFEIPEDHDDPIGYADKLLPVGLEIDWHCSDDCAQHMLIVAATKQWANRGYPVQLDINALRKTEHLDAIVLLHNYIADKHGNLDRKHIGWQLYSYWG